MRLFMPSAHHTMFVALAPSHREHIAWDEVTHVRIRPGAHGDTAVGRRALEHIRSKTEENGLARIADIEDGFPTTRTHTTKLQGMRAELRHMANSRHAGKDPENKGLVELGHLVADEAEFLYPDEVADTRLVCEGTRKTVSVNVYERDRTARFRCIAHWGTKCTCCGISFERTYGPRGAGFIHVHHLVPLASVGAKYTLDPVADLRPVCPNCHAIIHRFDPPLSIDDVKIMIADAAG